MLALCFEFVAGGAYGTEHGSATTGVEEAGPPTLLSPIEGRAGDRRGMRQAHDGGVRGPHEEDALRTRMARIDTELLGAVRESVARSGTASLRLNLVRGVDLDVAFERTAQTRFGYSLSGHVKGDPLGSVTLVVNGNIVAATVHSSAGTFIIGSRNGVIHTVEEIVDGPGPSIDQPVLLPERRGTSGGAVAAAAGADDGSELDILILFTRAALRVEGGLAQMQATMDFAVAYVNDAFAVSGVNLRMRLVAGVLVGYEEFADPATGGLHRGSVDLARLFRKGDGYLDHVHELRDRYAADIVHLVVDQSAGGANVHFLQSDAADPSVWAFGASNSLRSGWALVYAVGAPHGPAA